MFMKSYRIFLLAGLASGLCACATKTTEGPVASGPVVTANQPPTPHQRSSPVATSTPRPRPTPTPTPDPFAPTPIPQRPQTSGVSPLSHGPDQPLYQRQ